MRFSHLLLILLFGCHASAPVPAPTPPTSEENSPPAPESAPESTSPTPEINEHKAPAKPDPHVRWTLEVEPRKMTMAQRDRCRVRVQAKNEGDAPVTPMLGYARLKVNGQPSVAGDLILNGAMEPSWSSLPPGQTSTLERAACPALFESPGNYVFELEYGDTTSKVDVTITP